MKLTGEMFSLILLTGLVTLIPRILPFIFIRKIQMPDVVEKWLSFIPICILSALVFENIFKMDGKTMVIEWSTLLVIIPLIAIAWKSKSLSITVFFGVVFMAVMRYFI